MKNRILLLISLVICGCSTNKYIVEDSIKKNIIVENIKKTQTETDLFEATLVIRNRGKEQILISIRTLFYNRKNQLIETSSWAALFVDSQSSTNYTINATQPEARRCDFEIRKGR